MWVKVSSTWYNLDNARRLEVTGASNGEVRAGFDSTTNTVLLRSFSTQAEAEAWVTDTLDNVQGN